MPFVAGKVLDPDEVSKIRMHLPKGTKNLRACLRCRIIMTRDQFISLGCPTCRDVLRMQHDEARVTACTTTRFQGFITLMQPGAFVSRFCGLDKRKPGCYALAVQGSIPDHILNESEFERESELEERLSRRSSERAAPTPRSLGKQSPRQHDTESESAASLSDGERRGTEKAGNRGDTSPVAKIAGSSSIDKALAFAEGDTDSDDDAIIKKDMEAELFGDFNSEDDAGPVADLGKTSSDVVTDLGKLSSDPVTDLGTPGSEPVSGLGNANGDKRTSESANDNPLFSDDSPAEKKRRVEPEILEKEGDTEFKQV